MGGKGKCGYFTTAITICSERYLTNLDPQLPQKSPAVPVAFPHSGQNLGRDVTGTLGAT